MSVKKPTKKAVLPNKAKGAKVVVKTAAPAKKAKKGYTGF